MSKEGEHDTRTVFVRNLAFDVDQAQLEQAFADIGPVRSAFLVSQKGQQRHKGIAFVQYAIPEDADRAVEELNGKDLNGRKLKIEHARKRAPLAERKQRKRSADDDQQQQHEAVATAAAPDAALAAALAAAEDQPAVKKQKTDQAPKQRQQQQQQPAAADKHKWVRSIALGGLKPEFKPYALQLAASAAGLEEVLDPPPADVAARAHLLQDGCTGDVVFVVYHSVKEAAAAVKQLHGKQLTGTEAAAAAAAAAEGATGGSKKKQKKLDRKAAKAAARSQQQQQQQQQQEAAAAAAAVAAEDSVVLWARAVSGEGALVKKWRLILRNLPWQATESEIKKLLAPSDSFPWQIQIPTNPDGRTRGFAFVSFLSFHEADKALKSANGLLVRKRPVAVDWAVGKGQYEELKSRSTAAAAAAAAGEDHDHDHDHDQGGSGGSEQSEDASEDQDTAGLSDGGGDDHDDAEDDDDQDQDLGGFEELDEGVTDDESDHDDDDDEEEEEASGGSEQSAGAAEEFEHDREVVASALDAVLASASEQQQQPAAAAAGQKQASKQQQQQVRSEPAAPAAAAAAGSGAVASTVFVRGISLDTSSQELQARFDRFGAVKACRLVINKTTGKPKGTAFIEFKTPEGAAAAAAACARAREGKGPDILVKGVKLEVDLALTGDDARKLGQCLTGVVGGQGQSLTGGSKGAGGKFDRRNLYLAKEGFIEEGSAQWMAMSENDRRKRKRAAEEKNEKLKSPNFAVSTTRLAIRNIPSSWDEQKLRAVFIAGVKERATKEKPQVKQAKILRDPERTDPGGNPAGKSRGFGFIEFTDPGHALAALRQLNNNPTAFGRADRRPIVEFAVDNVKILKARDDKLAKQKQQQRQKKEQQQQQQQLEEEGEAEGQGVKGSGGPPPAAAAVKVEQVSGDVEKQQQQQQQQQQEDGEPLSKRQLKRRKEKQKKLKRQQQQQQQNGAVPAAANKQQQQHQQQRQRGKKGAVATAAATAAAEAKAARLQAKAERQQQQAVAEETVRSRKRRADDDLDRLAAAAADGRAGVKQQQQQQQRVKGAAAAAADGGRKRLKPEKIQEERLEKMVEAYKSKLFGFGNAAAAAVGAGAGGERVGIKASRWFD